VGPTDVYIVVSIIERAQRALVTKTLSVISHDIINSDGPFKENGDGEHALASCFRERSRLLDERLISDESSDELTSR